jgi:hypothetical protein
MHSPKKHDALRRREADSHVRLKTKPSAVFPPPLRGRVEWLEASDLLDQLCEDQLTLSMSLACLERASLERPRDPCAQAALRSIEGLLYDLRNVRDALAIVQMAAFPSSVHRVLLPDAPLSDYLRGVYAWLHAAVRALDDLVSSFERDDPQWALYRWRVEQAKNFHFHELERAVRADLDALVDEGSDEMSVGRLATTFNALLKDARGLEERLDQGLG